MSINMTSREFRVYGEMFDVLSDVDFSYNYETGEYDVPALEWDGPFGKHWTRYESIEARDAALAEYRKDMYDWVLEYRERVKAEAIANGKRIQTQRRALKEAKTLGGNFPILKQLLHQLKKV